MPLQMNQKDRKRLGRLIAEWCKRHAERTYYDDVLQATKYVFQTCVGELRVWYAVDMGDIFGRFAEPLRAAQFLGERCNKYTGKWNFHSFHGDYPDAFFVAWRKQMELIEAGGAS